MSNTPDTNSSNDDVKGVFNEEDYWPYIFGVMIIAGLIITPYIFSYIPGLENKKPIQLAALGFMYAMVFCIAHTKTGRISFRRLLLGLGLILFAVVQTFINTPSHKLHVLYIVIPGLLPIAAMYLSGWIGVFIGRSLLGSNTPNDPSHTRNPQGGKETHSDNGLHDSESSVDSGDQKVIEKSELFEFIHSSYLLWKEGTLDYFDGSFKTYASKKPPDKLANKIVNNESWLKFLEFCFSLRATEAGEFMIGMEFENFLLTNKYLYIYESKKLDKMHVIDICEIDSYKCEKKILTSTLVLNLRDQTEISCKLFQLPSGEAIQFLQELNDCTNLLEVEYLVD